MAIAFDAKTLGAQSGAGVTSTTFSHTVSGTDRFLIVSVTTFNFTTGTPTPTATYNGVTMTPLHRDVVVFDVNNWRHHLFYLINPDTGANNVVVTRGTGTGIFRGLAVSYTGVDQVNPVLTSNIAGSLSGNTMQISLTTSENAWWYISGGNVDGNWTAGGNTSTIRDASSTVGAADSNGDISAQTGNAQMSHGGTRGYGGVALAFKPAGGGGGAPTPTLMMMGMGT